MTITLDKIQERVVKSYTKSLSKEDLINSLLDKINDRKKKYDSLAKGINELSGLIRKITWLNNLSDSDEVIIRGIIAMGEEAVIKYKKFLDKEREAFVPQGLFLDNFETLEYAIENHMEAIVEVSDIIFNVRKDKEFIELSRLLDEL